MPALNSVAAPTHYTTLTSFGGGISLLTNTRGPKDGAGNLLGKPARRLIVLDITAGDVVEVVRPDGVTELITSNAKVGQEFWGLVATVTANTTVTELRVEW